jgi:sporulation-control protein
MLQALGVGGPSVDTILTNPDCRPGGYLEGQVQVHGGDHAVDVEYVAIGLITRVEVESGDAEYNADQEFHRQRLTGSFKLDPGARHDIPFRFDVPWETPITEVYGQHLHGMTMGMTTELEVARAVDKSDLDAVVVHPLPAQERILDALLRLGFRFSRADVERGRVYGVHQTLPFYQEIEFFPPSQYRGLNQVELSFVADEHAMDVILEMDKKPGLFSEGSDTFRSFQVGLHDFQGTDWAAYLNQWLSEVGSKRNWF